MTATEAVATAGSEQQARAGSYLAAIAATWFLYLVGYAAFSYAGYGEGLGVLNTAVQTSLDLVAAGAAGWFLRRHRGWVRFAFLLIALASVGMALTNLFWGVLFNIIGDTTPGGYVDLSFRVPFLAAVLCWLAFWGVVLLRQTERNISVAGIAALAALAAVAVAVFVAAYLPLLSVETPGHVHVFVLVYASLELVGLFVCLCAAILKTQGFPTFLAAGFILIVATDFLFNTGELTGSLEPNEWAEIPWVLAEACIAAGVFAFHAELRRAAAEPRALAREREAYAHNMMSILLFAGLLAGAVLAIFLLVERTEIRVFAILLLVGLVVIAGNRFALLHGEAVRCAVGGAVGDGEGGDGLRLEPVLRAFGSYRPIASVRATLRRVIGSSLRVGDGFTFRTSDTWKPPRPRSMFFVMPYRKHWSDDVHRTVSDGAAAAGWHVNRADHRFSHQDLLLNIWVEMCRSEIVVADITGHTPNVLYEIGIAHAIGKAVILIIQQGEAIPFDLSVQRTIFYAPADPGWKVVLAGEVARLLAALDEQRAEETAGADAERTVSFEAGR